MIWLSWKSSDYPIILIKYGIGQRKLIISIAFWGILWHHWSLGLTNNSNTRSKQGSLICFKMEVVRFYVSRKIISHWPTNTLLMYNSELIVSHHNGFHVKDAHFTKRVLDAKCALFITGISRNVNCQRVGNRQLTSSIVKKLHIWNIL